LTLPDFRGAGDLADRLTIVQHKVQQHDDAEKRRICQLEADSLEEAWQNAKLTDLRRIDGFSRLRDLNARIWEFENAFRVCEQNQDIARLPQIMCEAHGLNETRTKIRNGLTAWIDREYGVDLIEIRSGLDAFADRVAIAQIIDTRTRPAETGTWRQWREVWLASGLPDIFDGPEFRRLHLANDRLWDVKRAMDAWLFHDQWGDHPVAVARSLYLINDARCQAKVHIASWLGSAFWETKKYPPYQVPVSWDDTRLRWATVGEVQPDH